MKTSDIKGIIPPVITPMNNDPEQTVNHQALREQVERLLAGGVHGIFPMGTNGEANRYRSAAFVISKICAGSAVPAIMEKT